MKSFARKHPLGFGLILVLVAVMLTGALSDTTDRELDAQHSHFVSAIRKSFNEQNNKSA